MSTSTGAMTIDAFPAGRMRRALGLAVSSHFSLLLLLGLWRHSGYMSSALDLGVFDQAVWGMLHGQWFLNTSVFNTPLNWLGFHFNPVLVLFAPLYWFYPAAEWFAIAQALALSIAAWPVFLLASRVCQSERTGLLWAIVYLVNPFLLSAAAWDFHPVALAVPFIAAGFLAVEKGDDRLLTLSCVALLLIQEQFGVSVIGFGLLWWLRHRGRGLALTLVALGLAHFCLVLGVVMPALSPFGAHPMMTEELGHLSRYRWLGSTLSEMLANLALKPLSVLRIVALEMGGVWYLGMLLAPFLGLSLLAPMYLLPIAGDLAANLLSANGMPRAVTAYHSAALVPVFVVAAVYGSQRAACWLKRVSSGEIAGLVLVASIALGYLAAPLPLPGAMNFWSPTEFVHVPDPMLDRIKSALGDGASVSAQANAGAHFSQRLQLYRYPQKVGEVDAIVLRLESPTHDLQPQDPGSVGTLAHHLQMRPADYLASIDCLLSRGQYGAVLWEDPWLVLRRGAVHQAALLELRQKLDALRAAWQVSTENLEAALQSCA